MKFPRDEKSVRPFRLWDASAKVQMRWRYYTDPKRAHIGALIEARWSKVGAVVEVFDVRNGKLLGQYRRGATQIHFTRGTTNVDA